LEKQPVTSMHIFGQFVWRGFKIDDVTIHPSRGSRINPTLKVCEHKRVAHASGYTHLLNYNRYIDKKKTYQTSK